MAWSGAFPQSAVRFHQCFRESRGARTALAAAALAVLPAVAWAGLPEDSLPAVASGARPGPDVLYSAAPAAPQLENRDPRFKALPLLVSGNEAYADGEYLYQDFLYDDYGSDTDGKGAHPLSEQTGDISYPTDAARYGNNSADLVELRIAATATDVAYRITLNTLLVADSTIVTLAFDSDRDALTGAATLPRDPGASFPGTDEVLTIWGAGAEYSRQTMLGWTTTPLAASVDLEANQITVVVPRTVSDPHGPWRATIATGLYDPATGGWLKPFVAASATTPGGAGPLDPVPSGIFNLGFRFDEAVLSADTPPDSDQAVAIRSHAPTTYAHDIDFSMLDSHASWSSVPASGTQVRMFPSRLVVGEGRDLNDFPGYRGQLQPYSLYVPTTYVAGTPSPFMLNLHSLGEHYWQYNGLNMTQQIGEQRGSLVATSLSRGDDGWYQHEAEYDVFEMWNDVARRFHLDPDRMAISGYSMGGYATYRLGTLYPDLFAKAFSQVGPPAEGIWLPPAPPTGSYRGDDFTTNPEPADATLTNLWLENARNVPYLNLAASTDELVPLVGPRAQNIGDPASGVRGFDQLGYRFRFLVFTPCDHLALALLDDFPMAAEFLGDAAVDRNPVHVTFAYVPASDDAALGLVHDHAYWVSQLTLADTSAGVTSKGVVDAFSHAFGVGDPGSVAGSGAGTVGPISYVELNRSWSDAPAIAVENRLDVTLTNLASVHIDLARAGLRGSRPLVVHTSADGASSLSLDGVFAAGSHVYEDDVPVSGASVGADVAVVPVAGGEHTYVISAGQACSSAPRSGCRRSLRAGASRVAMIRGANDDGNRLTWNWGDGAATSARDFGDPMAGTGYAVCVYDGTGQAIVETSALSEPSCLTIGASCWQQGRRGLSYRSSTSEPSGLTSLRLEPGEDSEAGIAAGARGALLALPELPLTVLPLTVQLQAGGGGCWESQFTEASRSDGRRFKARGQ